MPSDGGVTKDQLLAELRASGTAAGEALRALPEHRFDEGRYESGWNGRQILAHLAAIEWTYSRLLDLPADTAAGDRGGAGPSSPGAGMDGYNARQVEKRAAATIPELLAEFDRNRAATIAAVEAADDTAFSRPTRSAGGRTGSLGRVFYEVAVLHVQAHVADIVGG